MRALWSGLLRWAGVRRRARSMRPRAGPRGAEWRQRGQSMVLVALLLIAFIGLLAVTLDGGYAFLQRRNSQSAADAGALAGARELCLTGDTTLATQAAVDYAITRNQAEEADVVINSGEVEVTARIRFDTFFGSLLGRPEIVASGVAAANCFSPGSGSGMLPMAWNCSPPMVTTESPDCEILYDKTYIIMDSKTVDEDFNCQDPITGDPPSALDCDYDDDGVNDLLASGNRSWLDLDGGGGGSTELVDWINGEYPGELNIHTWFGGQTGVANNVFQAAHGRVDDTVLIPVFDKYCDQPGFLPEDVCPTLYDPEDTTVASGGAATLYYHVMSFALFKITCVHAPPHTGCPGHDAAGLGPNDKSIEGHFVQGFASGGGGSGGVDAGAYVLYLTR